MTILPTPSLWEGVGVGFQANAIIYSHGMPLPQYRILVNVDVYVHVRVYDLS